uniref:Chitin-binding type-2 domain-containing protein n=1 Tax=Parastrongyloides trichosuri TaxID=131310 RepID=A0A0N4Z9Q1_PARTI
MSEKDKLENEFGKEEHAVKLPDSQLHNPIWMVTRRQQTEVSPVRVRDADTQREILTSPYHTRSVTTTERVHIMQTPLNIDIEDINEDMITSLSPTGNATRTVYSTTSTHLEGPTQIHGGVTASGVPLHMGIQIQPESKQTTTVITTTTTTYRVVESSEDVPMETDEEMLSPMTIDLQFLRSLASPKTMHVKTDILMSPTNKKNFDFDASTNEMNSPKDHNYVIVNKSESSNPVSPSSEKTRIVFEYIPYDSKYPEPNKYTGPVDITYKKNDLQTLPIQHHVQIYHPSGQSDIPVEMENSGEKIGGKRHQKDGIFKNLFKRRRSTSRDDHTDEIPMYIDGNDNPEKKEIKDLDEMALDDEGNLISQSNNEGVKKGLGSKITQFFKRSESKEKYPLTEKIEEDLSYQYLSLKPEKTKQKITATFLTKTAYQEYPYEQPYLGSYYDLARTKDISPEPVEFYISIYHTG